RLRVILKPAGDLPHLAGHFAAPQIPRGAGQPVLLALLASFPAQLIEPLAERFGPLRELLLLACETSRRVLVVARHGASGLLAHLPLARGQLARFQLGIPHGAPPLVRSGLAQRPLDAPQSLEGARALATRGIRVLAAKLTCGSAHVLRGLAEFRRLTPLGSLG